MTKSSKRNIKIGIRGSLPELKTILEDPSSKCVKTIFVGAPSNIGSTARLKTHDTTLQTLEQIAAYAHTKDIATDVVLNTFDVSQNPYSKSKEKKIKDFIVALENVGVEWITLSYPIWIKWTSEVRKKIKINLSVYANADNPLFAKEFVELGADMITIPSYLNKNITLMKRIKKFTGVPLSLFVNSKCVTGGACPYLVSHRIYKSAQADVPVKERGKSDPFPANYCIPERKKDLAETLFTPTIRPEDLHFYEKIGIDSFKIATRQDPPERVIKLIKAYSQRTFDGPFGELWTVTPMKDTPANRFLDGAFEKVRDLPDEEQFEYYEKLAKKYQKSNNGKKPRC